MTKKDKNSYLESVTENATESITDGDFGNVGGIIMPGVSWISHLGEKTGVLWEDAEIFSLQGRRQNYAGALRRGAKIILLGGDGFQAVLEGMCQAGYGKREVWIVGNPGSSGERILHGCAEELLEKATEQMSILMIAGVKQEAVRIFGLDDSEFIRSDIPMTKSEVRAVVMSRLAPGRSDIIYDIGAGTGSVSVEAAMAAPYGCVYAIEKKEAACRLIKKNSEKFLAGNIEIVKGEAPEVLKDLPAPDRVFIGGTGGNLEAIFAVISEKNPQVKVVITAVTIETLQSASKAIEDCGFACTEITQITATRYNRRGIYHMPDTQSPVWVMAAELVSKERNAKVLRRRQLKTMLKEKME